MRPIIAIIIPQHHGLHVLKPASIDQGGLEPKISSYVILAAILKPYLPTDARSVGQSLHRCVPLPLKYRSPSIVYYMTAEEKPFTSGLCRMIFRLTGQHVKESAFMRKSLGLQTRTRDFFSDQSIDPLSEDPACEVL